MKNKRISVLSFLIIITIMLSGCNGSMASTNTESQAKDVTETETTSQTDTESESIETREVIFLNHVYLQALDAVLVHEDELHSQYEIVEDENALYAFRVTSSLHPNDYPPQGADEDDETFSKRRDEYIINTKKELLLAEGFVLIDNYPWEGEVVVAGTMAELKRVFTDIREIDGWYFCATSAVRPDMYDILKETGWKEGEDVRGWFTEHYNQIQPLLGTDANQVTLTVPVIVPDETTETE